MKLMKNARLLLSAALCVVLIGCGTIQRPDITNTAEGIATTAADIETAAETIRFMCGNTIDRGSCRPGALIDTDDKERLRGHLLEALDFVDSANNALRADEALDAENKLGRARSLLGIIQSEIARRQSRRDST